MPVAADRSKMNLPQDKFCPKCETTMLSAHFHLSKSEKDSLHWACKACTKDLHKLVDQKKLAYKPFSALLQEVLMKDDKRKLLKLVNKVFDTAMSDSPAAVSAQKILVERLEGKLREEVAITADTGTQKLISDANDLLQKMRKAPEPELMLPVEEERKTLN